MTAIAQSHPSNPEPLIRFQDPEGSTTYLADNRLEYAIRLGSGELSRPMDTMQEARMALLQSVMMAQDDDAYEDAEVVVREVITITSYTDWTYPVASPSPHL